MKTILSVRITQNQRFIKEAHATEELKQLIIESIESEVLIKSLKKLALIFSM